MHEQIGWRSRTRHQMTAKRTALDRQKERWVRRRRRFRGPRLARLIGPLASARLTDEELRHSSGWKKTTRKNSVAQGWTVATQKDEGFERAAAGHRAQRSRDGRRLPVNHGGRDVQVRSRKNPGFRVLQRVLQKVSAVRRRGSAPRASGAAGGARVLHEHPLSARAGRCARGKSVGALYEPLLGGQQAQGSKPYRQAPLTLSLCRVEEFVGSMWESAPKKYCNQTAEGLAALPAAWAEAMSGGGTEALERVIEMVHKDGTCLAGMMFNWANRDIYCRNDPKDQMQSRMMMVLLQYYKSFHGIPGSSAVEMPSPVHRRELASAGIRRADPVWKSFCLVQVADFLKDGGNLFDKTKCGGKHPVWSDLGPGSKWCSADCWAHMKAKMKDGGCVALYYETMFDLAYNVGRTVDADAGTNTFVTVKSLVEKMDSTQADAKCTEGEGRAPCTAINDAIASCAESNGEEDYVQWTAKAEKMDQFGATTKGGVKCWQGSHCH